MHQHLDTVSTRNSHYGFIADFSISTKKLLKSNILKPSTTGPKRDYRIISRDEWADENLKANISDYEPLPLPLSGVIAHHTSVAENRCFTIGT